MSNFSRSRMTRLLQQWETPKSTLASTHLPSSANLNSQLAEFETRTTREIINLWSQTSGKPADYVQVPLDHYDNLWPKWGREIGLMLQFWETAREKSWTADEPVLTKEDLNISGLIGMKEIFSSLEWS